MEAGLGSGVGKEYEREIRWGKMGKNEMRKIYGE
jgi:hypothetical protein